MNESSRLQPFRQRMACAALRRCSRAVLLGALSLSFLAGMDAAAATFTVDSFADSPDSNTADGICNDGTNHCTLRAAIQQADFSGGANTINVPAGTYLLNSPLSTTNPANNLSITGTGAAGATIIDGQNATTIFSLDGGTVNLTNLVIQHGAQTLDYVSRGMCVGAGIFLTRDMVVNLTSSVVQNNSAINGSGGGICIGIGTMNIDRSTIAGNMSSTGGSAIRLETGALNISNSTISNNVIDNTGFNGGCGAIESQGTVYIQNSTLSGNKLGPPNNGAFAGALCTYGSIAQPITTSIRNSTITNNTGANGQLYVQYGTTSLESTIVANPDTGNNCTTGLSGNFASSGHNLDSDRSCGLFSSGDIGGNPKLGPLQDNGGPTATHALAAGSPAIGAGSNSLGLATDQRGVGYPRVVAGQADIGAFESPYARRPPLVPQLLLLLD